MKKYLELGTPVSNCYQFMAYPLSILANHEESNEWIYSNFIQTCLDLNLFISPVPYYYYIFDYTISPWLEVQKLNRNIINKTGMNIIYFIEKSIELGYCIYLNIDEFYIPNRGNYLQKHFSHDILVNGFDSELEELNIYGFTNKKKLESSVVSYDSFYKSYISANEIEKVLTQVILYKYNLQGEYSFKIDAFVNELKDYMNGVNSSERFIMLKEPLERVYGVKGYEYIKKYIEECFIKQISPDLRIFHFLYEHKCLMKQRIIFLINKGYISNSNIDTQWDFIIDKALLLRNKIIKISITGFSIDIYNIIKMYIDDIENNERVILNNLLLQLQ